MLFFTCLYLLQLPVAAGYVAQSDHTFAVIAGSQEAVISWGDSVRGGESTRVSSNISSGVKQVVGNEVAVAALTVNGSVHSWGVYTDAQYVPTSTWVDLESSVHTIVANDGMTISMPFRQTCDEFFFSVRSTGAFCALKTSGKVIVFGLGYVGGSLKSPFTAPEIATAVSSNIISIFANKNAFTALRNDRTVYCWGRAEAGCTESIDSLSLIVSFVILFYR